MERAADACLAGARGEPIEHARKSLPKVLHQLVRQIAAQLLRFAHGGHQLLCTRGQRRGRGAHFALMCCRQQPGTRQHLAEVIVQIGEQPLALRRRCLIDPRRNEAPLADILDDRIRLDEPIRGRHAAADPHPRRRVARSAERQIDVQFLISPQGRRDRGAQRRNAGLPQRPPQSRPVRLCAGWQSEQARNAA